MIKLIGIDIDGTLLNSRGEIPADNLAALADAAARGVRLAIVTGRSFFFALPHLAPLPDPLTLIVHNGAIARTRAGETLFRRLLPRAVAREAIAATRAWRDSTVLLFDRPHGRQMVYDRMDWQHPNRIRFHARNREILEEVDELEQALTEDPIQVAYNGSVEAMRGVIAELQAHEAADRMAISLTEYPQRDFSLVDVCSAGTTKGRGLAELAHALGIRRDEVLAIGDNHNDRDMLAWAGIGVVMGNACEELRCAGFEQTGTNDDCGLAEAVRRFVL